MKDKGYTERELVLAGLAKSGKRGGVYDAFRNRLMELTVIKTGKSAALIYNARDGIRKRRVLYPVKHHRSDGYLPDIAFSPRFGRNNPCKQLIVSRRISAEGAVVLA